MNCQWTAAFQKYEFNALLKVSARREDNLLALNKHLFLTIDVRNKKRASDLHLKDFLIS